MEETLKVFNQICLGTTFMAITHNAIAAKWDITCREAIYKVFLGFEVPGSRCKGKVGSFLLL